MSQENVRRMIEALDAFARRDQARWSRFCDPEVEAVPVGDWPEREIRGIESVWDFLVATDEPWEPGAYEVVEVHSGRDTVAARMWRKLRGKSSGAEVDYDYWAVLSFRDEVIIRVEWFNHRRDALEAAGLSE
jgi:ketosteroid isomerase-like protein